MITSSWIVHELNSSKHCIRHQPAWIIEIPLKLIKTGVDGCHCVHSFFWVKGQHLFFRSSVSKFIVVWGAAKCVNGNILWPITLSKKNELQLLFHIDFRSKNLEFNFKIAQTPCCIISMFNTVKLLCIV